MSTDTPTPETPTDSEKLRALALYLDMRDAKYGNEGNEVQDDLRRIADQLESESAPTNKPEAPMSWEQALQEVGKVEEVDSIYRSISDGLISASICEEIFTTAAELYAENAFHRGSREQREICADNVEYEFSHPGEQQFVDRNSILNAPAPEFKA